MVVILNNKLEYVTNIFVCINDRMTIFDPYEYDRIANNSKHVVLMDILSYVSVVV